MIPFEQAIAIDTEIRTAYLNYSMSVIVGRALPDIRDGLKPVQRRVLFAMHEMGVRSGGAYKKSARIVGDVIGKYHPHGDTAVYDTAVRLVQPFTLRYPLIDGQGNFGSIDGDSPAAMRYTEIRLKAISEEMMSELSEETVAFGPNYDESLEEPKVLPAKLPLLLLNGSSGIAVGMATNIPPHNSREILNALLEMIDNPSFSIEDLLRIVTGPDFPTGGLIMGRSGIEEAFRTGRGSVVMRGVVDVEESSRADRQAIVISEIPYMVNKTRLIEKIAALVRDKEIDGIADIRDESNREGMRIVLDLKRDGNPQVIINRLYSMTALQSSFGVNFVAIVNQRPVTLSLLEALRHFLDFRQDVVTKRTLYRLKKARERFHILEGLKRAIDLMDQIIALIRASDSPETAREGLMNSYAFSEIQARAILDMRLQRLTALERDKIEAEYEEVRKIILELERILGSRDALMSVVRDEFVELREKFGDDRRTRIVPDEGEIDFESLIPDDPCYVNLTFQGYIKRLSKDAYPTQNRGGKGRIGVTLKEDDAVIATLAPTMHETILFFTDVGKVYRLKVHEIPEGQRATRGKSIRSLLALAPDEKVTQLLSIRSFGEEKSLVFVTEKGKIKRTQLIHYGQIRQSGIIAISLEEGDRLAQVMVGEPGTDILIATKGGKGILIPMDDPDKGFRSMGRTAAGVKGIKLATNDLVVGAEAVREDDFVAVITARGYGKRVETGKRFRLQGRGGQGVRILGGADKIGPVVSVIKVTGAEDVFLITQKGQALRIETSTIRLTGRTAQGVKLLNLQAEDEIQCASLAPLRGETEDGSPST